MWLLEWRFPAHRMLHFTNIQHVMCVHCMFFSWSELILLSLSLFLPILFLFPYTALYFYTCGTVSQEVLIPRAYKRKPCKKDVLTTECMVTMVAGDSGYEVLLISNLSPNHTLQLTTIGTSVRKSQQLNFKIMMFLW